MPRRALDSGSGSAALREDPRGAVEDLAGLGRIEIPHLRATRDYTAQRLQRLRSRYAGEELGDQSIVMFGSWARGELTEESDDDFAVVSPRRVEPNDEAVAHAMRLAEREHIGQGARQPGTQDIFGVAFDAESVVAHVGLDGDSNKNLTRRMLLLLESVEVAGHVHAECLDRVLHRYLERGVKPTRPPRFLLNDLVRYWRTICVDFEGKHPRSRRQ